MSRSVHPSAAARGTWLVGGGSVSFAPFPSPQRGVRSSRKIVFRCDAMITRSRALLGVLHESIPPIAAMSTEAEATESAAASEAKTPADFLRSIRGKQVVVKLNSGVDYRGVLACLDGYMNIAMEQTEVGGCASRTKRSTCRPRGEREVASGEGEGRMERRRDLGSSRGGVGQERRWRLTPPSRGRETGAEPYLEEVFGTQRLPRRMNE